MTGKKFKWNKGLRKKRGWKMLKIVDGLNITPTQVLKITVSHDHAVLRLKRSWWSFISVFVTLETSTYCEMSFNSMSETRRKRQFSVFKKLQLNFHALFTIKEPRKMMSYLGVCFTANLLSPIFYPHL